MKIFFYQWLPVWAGVAFLSTLFTLFLVSPRSHAVSGEAVYIEGLSCTVNMERGRNLAKATKDFQKCLEAHAGWEKRNNK